MMDFNRYVSRHGEYGAQALIERLERYDGIKPGIGASLEDRWNSIMHKDVPEHRLAA